MDPNTEGHTTGRDTTGGTTGTQAAEKYGWKDQDVRHMFRKITDAGLANLCIAFLGRVGTELIALSRATPDIASRKLIAKYLTDNAPWLTSGVNVEEVISGRTPAGVSGQ